MIFSTEGRKIKMLWPARWHEEPKEGVCITHKGVLAGEPKITVQFIDFATLSLWILKDDLGE